MTNGRRLVPGKCPGNTELALPAPFLSSTNPSLCQRPARPTGDQGTGDMDGHLAAPDRWKQPPAPYLSSPQDELTHWREGGHRLGYFLVLCSFEEEAFSSKISESPFRGLCVEQVSLSWSCHFLRLDYVPGSVQQSRCIISLCPHDAREPSLAPFCR